MVHLHDSDITDITTSKPTKKQRVFMDLETGDFNRNIVRVHPRQVYISSPAPKPQGNLKLGSYKFKSKSKNKHGKG